MDLLTSMLPSASPLALEDLGWASFQDLAMAYAEDLLDAPVTTYAKSWDGGVDGEQVVFGPAAAPGRPTWAIQAKHTGQGGSLAAASLKTEYAKLAGLVEEGFDAYLLITNFSVTRQTFRAIQARVLEAGFKTFRIQGRHQLVRRIRTSPKLRMMAPRVYGIGDLSLILDERRAEQTDALLAASRSDLDRFVATEPYRAAVRALSKDGMVVLLGEPAAGKSTIARVVSVAAHDAFGTEPYVLHHLYDLSMHWNPREPRLFWIDDVFGSTQAEFSAADTFNRMLPTLAAALQAGSRFVFTSRTYIWNAVQPKLKLSGIPRFAQGIVEVKVEDFSDRDKALILANHVRLGDHSREWRKAFIPLAPDVARHPRFTPEVARRLGLEFFTGDLELVAYKVDAYVENPSSYLEELIEGLSPAGQAALALLFMKGGELPLTPAKDEALDVVTDAFAVASAQISKELAAMDGSLCRRQIEDEDVVWRFRHPSIGEAFASVAARSPVLLDVYLRGASPDRILEEAVCVGVTVKGAIVEIGRDHYDGVIARMKSHYWGRLSRLPRWFLMTRATPEFRRRYFTTPLDLNHPVLDDGRKLEQQTLALVACLAPEGLVDTEYLTYLRGRIRRGLLEWGLPSCLSTWARDIVGHEAFDDLLQFVVAELRDGGSSYMDFWEPSRNSEDSPNDSFKGLIEFVEQLEMHIDPEEAAEVLEIMQDRVNTRVTALEEQAQQDDWDRQEEEYYYSQRTGSAVRSSPSPRAPSFPTRAADPIADVFSNLDD